MAEGIWQMAFGRGLLAKGIWDRGQLEEGFWQRAFCLRGHLEKGIWQRGQLFWRAFDQRAFFKGIWQRAFGKGHFPKEQVEPTPTNASSIYNSL